MPTRRCDPRYFGGEELDAQGGLNLQATYDLKVAQKAVAKAIAKVVHPRDSTGENEERLALVS